MSVAYTLQEDITCNGQISTSGDFFFISQYMDSMQNYTKWYWVKPQQQQNIKFKKWTNRDYHVQKDEDVHHQDVRIYCATKQIP